MTKKQQKVLIRIILSAALTAVFCLIRVENPYLRCALFLVPYLIIGYDILRKAVLGIFNGQVFDENFLMAIATVGAFFVGEYAEAVAVMLFYQVGECFQSYAVNKSRKSIAELMDIRPDYANVMRNGAVEEVGPEEVAIGEVILIKPGVEDSFGRNRGERQFFFGYYGPHRGKPAKGCGGRGGGNQRLCEPFRCNRSSGI